MKKLKTIKAVRGTEKQEIRRLGVMMETVNDNLLFLAEGYNELKTDLKEVKRVQEIHTETIGQIAMDITDIKEELSKKVDKQDVEDIKQELRKKMDKKDIAPLQNRVTALETAR